MKALSDILIVSGSHILQPMTGVSQNQKPAIPSSIWKLSKRDQYKRFQPKAFEENYSHAQARTGRTLPLAMLCCMLLTAMATGCLMTALDRKIKRLAMTRDKRAMALAWCRDPRLTGTFSINVEMPNATCTSIVKATFGRLIL